MSLPAFALNVGDFTHPIHIQKHTHTQTHKYTHALAVLGKQMKANTLWRLPSNESESLTIRSFDSISYSIFIGDKQIECIFGILAPKWPIRQNSFYIVDKIEAAVKGNVFRNDLALAV